VHSAGIRGGLCTVLTTVGRGPVIVEDCTVLTTVVRGLIITRTNEVPIGFLLNAT
jgi:hypothetical protein